MRLLVGDHLQAVLDRAERAIAPREVVARRGVDPSGAGERDEHVEGAITAQLGTAPPGDQLLRLDKELDLADAATPELDIVPGDSDLLMAAIVVDLPLDRVDVGNRRKIEVLPPDERRQLGKEGLAGSVVAGKHPRLDQGGTLPVLAEALVVMQR